MRTPWYIYVPLCLIVTCVTLYLCVKDNDISTPPSSEQIHDSVELWKTEYPISEESVQAVKNGTHIKNEPISNQKSTEKILQKPVIKNSPVPNSKEPSQPSFDPSSINLTETVPALDSLLTPELSATHLAQYADLMIQQERPQLARIAHERIIDRAKDSTNEDRKYSANQINKLSKLTPIWNPDPSNRKILHIELNIDSKYKDQLEQIITELKKIVLQASDGNVRAEIKSHLNKATVNSAHNQSETAVKPILSSLRISSDTPLVPFTINDPADIKTKIPAALYYTVRSKNNLIQKLITIPERPTDISAQNALYQYITRLAWVNATTPVSVVSPTTPTEVTPSTEDSE